MSQSVLLLTDRPAFEGVWKHALDAAQLSAQVAPPHALAEALREAGTVIVDAGCEFFDEDELLATVGFARALRATCVVVLPEADGNGEGSAAEELKGIEDVLDDLCPGLVERGSAGATRMAQALARRRAPGRSRRFEYLTVSPRPNELLAILADGTATLLSRPLGEQDDGSEVSSITLGNDAAMATLTLGSGREVTVEAANVGSGVSLRAGGPVNGSNGTHAIDGARLGARLRELRMAAGLTQAELARRTGIHRPNIARVEAGRHTPSLETLARLASAIGVPTTHVLAEE
ncbi:MAG: helix-turn-helix transcriptional regulator [Myxococcales bacterium]